ncbi:FAD-binding oxidoreductase [Flavobacteriaceae bacterium]|nr:FAD-binding oxidoreductase [Flavobacteriaceae bacterium]MDB9828456.1 FAD-binding oxidoreductase [Flavobacteriaceae bacterium]
MNLSYWEQQSWFTNIDFAIIGSGIVGLSCALELRELHPEAKIVLFEKGMLPSGASTKNAGFACFGSMSEILQDLETHSPSEVVALISSRLNGLSTLRAVLTDQRIAYTQLGGYELFPETDSVVFDRCAKNLDAINELLFPIFNANVFSVVDTPFGFEKVAPKAIFNKFEGQLDTGKMMTALLEKAASKGVLILNNAPVKDILQNGTLPVLTIGSLTVEAKNICIATNGFATEFLQEDVQPARAQVLITKPIKNLAIKGTFHLDCGYYYFRNIDDRILFGGARNLAFDAENTFQTGLTSIIQDKLEQLLKTTILPQTPFEIDTRWSGIMGVGGQKKPIIKQIHPNVYCGVRLGGMGVAIGSTIGKELAVLSSKKQPGSFLN